jgi:hypothetical protein
MAGIKIKDTEPLCTAQPSPNMVYAMSTEKALKFCPNNLTYYNDSNDLTDHSAY